MASGKFQSSLCKAAGAGYYRYIEVVWSSTNDTANNTSTITWTAYSRSPDSSTTSYVYAKNIIVKINGTATTLIGSEPQGILKDGKLGGSTITVSHDSNGKKSVDVSITAEIYVYGETNSSYYGSITMSPNPVYTLSMSEGTGSNITVNRTSCAGSGYIGTLSNGASLWHGDMLKISFATSSNYDIQTHTVNGLTFTSGNTHTVSGNVSVISIAKPMKSTITATDAYIGSETTITVNRHDSNYTHTITYKFDKFGGTICSKSSKTEIEWTIPTYFYEVIPNDKYGDCRLWIQTFDKNGNIVGGDETCTCLFRAYTVESECIPDVASRIVSTDPVHHQLTGSDEVLIRYKSTAACSLDITTKKYAGLKYVLINNAKAEVTGENGTYHAFTAIKNITSSEITLTVTDTRGYTLSQRITPKIIDYIPLTCNPTIKRTSLTENAKLSIDVKGNYYSGAFGKDGANKNTLVLTYRFKERGTSVWSEWQDIDSSNITIYEQYGNYIAKFNTNEGFDYTKNYDFQVKAVDGDYIEGYPLTITEIDIIVPKSIPVFDWGENDFALHVPLKIGDTYLTEDNLKKLLDLIK